MKGGHFTGLSSYIAMPHIQGFCQPLNASEEPACIEKYVQGFGKFRTISPVIVKS